MSRCIYKERVGRQHSCTARGPAAFPKKIAFLVTLCFCLAFLSIFEAEPARANALELPATVQVRNDESPPEDNPDFAFLKGRWRRPDGGYLCEIKNIDATGKMDAAYRNPRLINISRAEASREGVTTKVFIELRDAGYPGCTYTLTYDPQTDQLKGVYFQAAIQQSFEVVFVRTR
ncbi:MAG TPA: hypothetical protein VK463_03210 [Desulfomonilaceae bacterium]|nr:hypothetical protein [Desulfomonilaceae bacterium]